MNIAERKTHRNYVRPRIDSPKKNIPRSIVTRRTIGAKRSTENSRANALRDWNFKGTQFRRNDVCGGSYALVRMPRVIGLATHDDVTRRTWDFLVSTRSIADKKKFLRSEKNTSLIFFLLNND